MHGKYSLSPFFFHSFLLAVENVGYIDNGGFVQEIHDGTM